ncbi:helix-turn-helix domain-containing protein [Flavobacterium fluviatile]|uniref:helix-turn-helix domain-containing protein n=1 Tax=Flavobacterium fluviatile TaxID=1862387 RepID=UPI0013D88885|nr:helix-turn-helix domain-containing protein [Flavobacterium fluviatile]
MMKDLLNIELKGLPIEGLDIHIIKKYVVKTPSDQSFNVKNLSILLIKAGRFKIQLQEAVQDLYPRDIIVIPKNSFCTLLEVQDKLQFFLITFSSEFAIENCLNKKLLDSFYFFIIKESLKITLDEKEFLVLSLIYKLIYFLSKDDKLSRFDYDLQRISFSLFLYELKFIYAKHDTMAALNFSRRESLAMGFLTVLSIHCRKQHHVKFYAGTLSVTPAHLSKIVKSITGKPAKILIIEAIIIEAKNLLDNSQLSILDIVEELEFDSLSSFSSFFKKYTFFSPSEYRSNAIERFKSR